MTGEPRPRLLVAKAWLGGAGLVAGLAGIALEIRWLVWVAIGLLGVAFVLRFRKTREAGSGKRET
jgi:membrane protein implicated in regulation of membrane protease activity